MMRHNFRGLIIAIKFKSSAKKIIISLAINMLPISTYVAADLEQRI